MDLRWGSNYTLSAFVGRSINPGESGNDWAGQLKIGRRTDLWEYGADINYLGPERSFRNGSAWEVLAPDSNLGREAVEGKR